MNILLLQNSYFFRFPRTLINSNSTLNRKLKIIKKYILCNLIMLPNSYLDPFKVNIVTNSLVSL